MALMSDAAMVLFCDVSSDTQGHDDWHSTEHMHERLSIGGFIRGTRWIRAAGAPRYMIIYEVAGVDVAHAPQYLERLDDPTPWTTSTMKRLRGMSRGFCRIAASAGYGLGHAACALRFRVADDEARRELIRDVPRMAAWRGMASVHLLEPEASPPMTKEQSIRGADAGMSSVLLLTAYDAQDLRRVCDRHLDEESLARYGITPLDRGSYELGFTATSAEVSRTPMSRPGQPRRAP